MIRKHYSQLSSFLILINLFFCIKTNAQSIGINTTTALPDPSAMLDIASTDKGLLIPRVFLNDTIDTVTIAHPAISLLVYNTNNSMTGGNEGFWHWNGSKWQQTTLPSGTTGAVPYYNGSKWVTNSTNFYDNGGNIGIGTNSPASLLSVGSSSQFQVNSSGNITMLNGTTTSFPSSNASGVLTNNGSGTLSWAPTSSSAWSLAGNSGTTAGTNFIGTTDAVDWVVKTNNTERMRVLSGGNVGIGTTSPSNKLDIEGAIAVGTTYSGTSTAPTNGAIIEGNVGIGTTSPNVYGLPTHKYLAVSNSTASGYGILNMSGGSGGGGQVNYGNQTIRHASIYSVDGSHLIFATNNTNSGNNITERMRITKAGNVGIGTTTPANKLDVEGSIAIGANYSGATAAPTNGVIIEGNVGVGTSTPVVRHTSLSTGKIKTAIVSSVSSTINSDEYSTVDSSIYLQIGGSEFKVNGYRLIGFGYSRAGSNPLTAIPPAYIGYQDIGSGTQTNGDLVFGTRSTTTNVIPAERMRILANGNIGIGTTTPANKLDVEGGISIGATYSGTTAAPTNGAIIEGNVGIGTSSPSSLLSVGSSSQFQVNSSGNIVKLNNVTTSFPSSNGTGTGVLKNDGSGNLSWSNNGAANIYEVHYSMGPSTINGLYTSPLTLVSAPGSSYYIEVISASISWSYSTTYTSNTTIGLYCHNATLPQASCALALPSTADGIYKFSNVSSGSSSDTQIIQNAALELKALTGNPSGGAGSADVYVLYRLIYN